MATQHATATIAGSSGFFINPTLVSLNTFFKPTAVAAAFRSKAVAPRPQPLGGLRSTVTVGSPRKPPGSQQGGVPTAG